jgi:hypothetical protein
MMEEGGCVLLIELLWLTASSYTPSAYLYDICKLYIGGLSLSRKHHKRPFIKIIGSGVQRLTSSRVGAVRHKIRQ